MNDLKFNELGEEYKRRFYNQADFLIEREYVYDISLERLAEKLYNDFMKKEKEKFENRNNPVENDADIVFNSKNEK